MSQLAGNMLITLQTVSSLCGPQTVFVERPTWQHLRMPRYTGCKYLLQSICTACRYVAEFLIALNPNSEGDSYEAKACTSGWGPPMSDSVYACKEGPGKQQPETATVRALVTVIRAMSHSKTIWVLLIANSQIWICLVINL